YWWPVWVTGFIMAALTYFNGTTWHPDGDPNVTATFHINKNLGVVFTFVFFLVILITNITLRGLASVVVLLAAAFTVLLFAYFDLWTPILDWLGLLAIYMNVGFYVFFSSLVFIVWAISTFIYDRLEYWCIVPGQVTHERWIGGSERSYDTRGMVFQ